MTLIRAEISIGGDFLRAHGADKAEALANVMAELVDHIAVYVDDHGVPPGYLRLTADEVADLMASWPR